jgi:general nucleoside transport system permease protein
VTGAALAGRVDLGAADRPKWAGWSAVALAIFAFWLTLPPLLVRTPAFSIVILVAAAGLAIWSAREGEARLGYAALVVSVLCLIGCIAATKSGEGHLNDAVVWSALAAAMLRFATPLVFGALGGIMSERSGVVNIGLEGMMLMGAFFGIFGADLTNSWVGGLVIGMLAGAILALVHAVFSISLRADQIVSGFAVNFLALGLTGYVFLSHYGEQGTPDNIPAVPDVSLPITSIPFFGPALDKLNLLVWVALILVFVIWLFIFRTPTGLRVRSVGENPRAAATVGISVYKIRYWSVIASGALAAMGGAFLSIGFVHSFSQNMTAGRGFIALAVVIVGKWRPGAALLAALMFGFTQALAQRLPVFSESSATLLQALPYVVTLIAVAGLVGRSIPPAADGIPYSKE